MICFEWREDVRISFLFWGKVIEISLISHIPQDSGGINFGMSLDFMATVIWMISRSWSWNLKYMYVYQGQRNQGSRDGGLCPPPPTFPRQNSAPFAVGNVAFFHGARGLLCLIKTEVLWRAHLFPWKWKFCFCWGTFRTTKGTLFHVKKKLLSLIGHW